MGHRRWGRVTFIDIKPAVAGSSMPNHKSRQMPGRGYEAILLTTLHERRMRSAELVVEPLDIRKRHLPRLPFIAAPPWTFRKEAIQRASCQNLAAGREFDFQGHYGDAQW